MVYSAFQGDPDASVDWVAGETPWLTHLAWYGSPLKRTFWPTWYCGLTDHAGRQGLAVGADLEAVAVLAGSPLQAEAAGEGFLEVLGGDRGHRADVLVVAQGIRGPPLPVGPGPGDVGDLGVDVQDRKSVV